MRLAVAVASLALIGSGCSSNGTGGGTGGGSVGGGAGGGSVGGGGGAGGGDGGTVDAGPVFLDCAVVRFNSNGTLDTSFGDGGIARVDLDGNTSTARDTLYSMAVDATNRLVLFGSSKATGRNDADRRVIRLTANGALDTSFANNGVATFDVNNAGDNARNGIVQADGKIVSAGYTAQATGVGDAGVSVARVVIHRLNDDGGLDTTFADAGTLNHNPFIPADGGQHGVAESYGARLQGTKYISAGYGRSAPSGAVNQIAFRYENDGTPDLTFGVNGVFELDLVGNDDRVRNFVVLPDDRILLLGSGSPTTGQIDGLATMLTANGALDLSFNTTGYKLYNFTRPDEAWYGAAVAPNGMTVASVGYRAGGGEDDDALLLVLPITGTAPAEFSGVVAASDTEHDRLWSVTFDAAGKIVAAGFVNVGGDTRMLVARFNTDGTRDTGFGTGGIATINVSVGRTDETARAVVVQSDGKIVIAGVADH